MRDPPLAQLCLGNLLHDQQTVDAHQDHDGLGPVERADHALQDDADPARTDAANHRRDEQIAVQPTDREADLAWLDLREDGVEQHRKLRRARRAHRLGLTDLTEIDPLNAFGKHLGDEADGIDNQCQPRGQRTETHRLDEDDRHDRRVKVVREDDNRVARQEDRLLGDTLPAAMMAMGIDRNM